MIETVKAYAKINLHLDVCGILDDGYHSVKTVMQSVSLFDDVTVELDDNGTFFAECNVDGVPTDEKNIAVRAAKLYVERIGEKCGARIKIDKNIPMAAGLAGGSADAAAALIALNRIFDERLAAEELFELGAMLGADVPFCIACGTLYSDGKGEKLHSFPQMKQDVIFAIACGGEGVSTPWGYRLLDEKFDRFSNYSPKDTNELEVSLKCGASNAFCKNLFNVFEAPILEHRPVAKEIKELFANKGAICALMSGSGPSVYAVFENENDALVAIDAIKQKGYFAAIARPIPARFAIYS
ncbi:MAG: 4-(cytidine 5'-diphospho)-2-C-methyl-D-erythritol kinase [Ruminococcaceae bacterium]|nr:4-(cytidine 5'-diphospho)-2-C-methyl-D-erythritol kinase [Oscillospiraceae bacterium]